jgi:hypothetical protein
VVCREREVQRSKVRVKPVATLDELGGGLPEKRRPLAQLSVSDEITPETRAAGHKTIAGVAGLLEHIRASGPMRKAPMGFVVAIMVFARGRRATSGAGLFCSRTKDSSAAWRDERAMLGDGYGYR